VTTKRGLASPADHVVDMVEPHRRAFSARPGLASFRPLRFPLASLRS
jgi:hypothetical protein